MTQGEECCRALMGKAQNNWATTFETLTPTQIMHSVEMLEQQTFPLEVVRDCSYTLIRWGWFRKAGLATKPPWEITNEDWATLIDLAPWEKRKRGEPEGQRSLFGVGAE